MIARRFSRPKATKPSVTGEDPSEPKSRASRIAAPLLGALAVAGICLPELLILIALAGSLTLGAFLGVAAGAVALALVAGFVLRHPGDGVISPGELSIWTRADRRLSERRKTSAKNRERPT